MDLVSFYANQHVLGIFATMGDRVAMAKDFMNTFRPGAAIHSLPRTLSVPTPSTSTKRKRDSSKASLSAIENKGGEPTIDTAPVQDMDHKVHNNRKRGGSNSSARVRSGSRGEQNGSWGQTLRSNAQPKSP